MYTSSWQRRGGVQPKSAGRAGDTSGGQVCRIEKHVGESVRKGDVLAIMEAGKSGGQRGVAAGDRPE